MVFHATFPPSGNPRPFEEIAITLAEATTEGRLGADVQLVIRTHPKFMSADPAARRPYEALARHEWVHVTDPVVNPGEGLDDELSLDDARLLGGLLKHCDVLVNVFSTTTLEAFLLDRPVVMALPDPNMGEYDRISQADPRRWNAFAHLKPLVDSGAARVARSHDELVEQVRAYLADPSLDRERRRQMADLECGPMDGHAGERTARLLLAELAIEAVPGSLSSAAGGGDHVPVNGGGPVRGPVPGEGAGAP